MTMSLFSISLDCADAAGLAAFWSSLLDRAVDDGATSEFASIGLQQGAAPGTVWMFHKVTEPKTAKNRVHIDFMSDNREKAVTEATDRGAKRLADVEESGYEWTTLADPAGNEFDIVAAP